ncbi:unnamed protein product [Rotaria socialis]|uniref:C3H1-type domain-containing protein n=1 Tax=Rotaria socialis TaxID=392032 RepID=A0A821FEM9_9BILA|nr:unnamed protein product [Rotaria socialis]
MQPPVPTLSISVPSYTSASASLKCLETSLPPSRVDINSRQLTEQVQQCPDQLPTEWECQVCTFFNINDDKRCIICHEGTRPERRRQVMHTDSVKPVSFPATPQPTSTIIGTVLKYVVYTPDLPADINAAELEQMIDLRLNSNHHIKVNKVTCHSSIGVGIVYVSNTTEKDALLNTVQSTVLDPKKNIIISFVRQLELVSYLVFDQKKKQTEIAVEVARRWAQLSKSPQLPACEQISALFPNIFKITSRSLDELLAIRTLDIFKVNEQFANVCLRADCSFVEDLPENITTTQITTAINTHIGGQYDQQTLYVQYNKEASSAIILAANAARKWINIDYLSFNSQVFPKKSQLAFCVVVHPVSSSVPINLITQHRQFQNAVTKHTKIDEKLIIELNDKSVYDQCLTVGALRVHDCPAMTIDPFTVILNDPKNIEINADNWYEMEMLDIKRPDIKQFVVTPEHPIFKYKWNAQHWLEQFERVKGVRDQQSDRKRHLLRVTTMLNTIGVIHNKSYTVETGGNKKEIKLKFEQLKTIAYNHRSKLPLSKGMKSVLKSPYQFTTVEVVNNDCLLVYEKLAADKSRPVLLNMANATTPGGGYRQGAGAQEENLFRRSNYYLSLDAELDDTKQPERYWCTAKGEEQMLRANESMYPMDEFGAIYTSGITVFRNTEDTGYAYLEQPLYDVRSIALAAYKQPELKQNDTRLLTDKNAMDTRKKIESLFVMAYHHQHDCLILSALGCGAFKNPPTHMASIFKSVIQQYAGYFKTIHFAIVDDHNTGNQHNPDGNYLPFKRILDGFRVNATTHELCVGMASGPFKVTGKDQENMIIDDVYIFGLPPCQYGAECYDLGDVQHCQAYSHPPLCPQHGACEQFLADGMHRSFFIHRKKCQHGGECLHITDEKHSRQYEHPEFCPANSECLDTSKDHLFHYRHLPRCKTGPIKCLLFLKRDPEHCRSYRHCKITCEFGTFCVNFHDQEHFNDQLHPFYQPCPSTPFSCRYYSDFLQAKKDPSAKTRPEVEEHCITFSHVCPFGRQCTDTSKLHSYTSIHIARKTCPDWDKCSKMIDEEHLNSFTHPKLPDIRYLCKYAGSECYSRTNHDHLIRFRHAGNYNHIGVVRYFGLNKRVNFVRNQYTMINTVRAYAEAEKWKEPKMAIPQQLIEWILALQPIHRCNKVIFESILVHGHTMSRDYMNLLSEAQFVANAIEQHNEVRRILDHHNNQALQNHGRDFIRALVAIEFDKAAPKSLLLPRRFSGVPNPYVPGTVHHSPNHDQQTSVANTKELQLKLLLTADEITTIRTHATQIAQASLQLHSNPLGIGHAPDQALGTNKHVFSIMGPHLGHYYGDIFIIFKRELMYHPDSNFSIQAATTFGASTNAYKMRPWLKDPGSDMDRIQQFHWNKLHCSVPGYEEAAAIELMALTGQQKKTMNVDLKDIQHRWVTIDSHQVFEMHLPQLIPLDYIDRIYMPTTVFHSLTPSAQQLAKKTFHDRLTITSHIVDLNALNQLDSTRVPYQKYVTDEIMKMITGSSFHSPQGTLITLPASKFEHQVAIPMTILQSYRQYQEQQGESDITFIYWQAMGGDMMLTVSNAFIDPTIEQTGLQCLTCYIADIPLTHNDVTYHESYSYVTNFRPYYHDMIMQDHKLMKAMSNSFHRGCNTDDYITYCLIIKLKSKEVILTHAGSNSIYNHQTINYVFEQSELDLSKLDYIYISAGARIVPVRNLVIRHQPIPKYHPSFDKTFKSDNTAVPSTLENIPVVASHSNPAKEQSPPKSIWNQLSIAILSQRAQ